MATFDFAGSADPADAGGVGAPPVPAPAGIPSIAASPTPSPPAPPDVATTAPPDPRFAAVIAALQPKPQPQGWQGALQKIAPALAMAFAMRQGAGGAFAHGYQSSADLEQKRRDDEAERQYRLFSILHQQQQEQEASARARIAEHRQFVAEQALTTKAAKEQADKADKLMRDEWTGVREGLIPTYNELLDSQGQEAADQYLRSTNVGALTAAGLPHTAKDLVDRYAVRGPSGALIDGKVKTPKEVAAGSKEEYVLRSRHMAQQEFGRPLADAELQKVDERALKRYGDLTKDHEQTDILKGIQIDNARLHQALLQQQLDRANQDKYGSAPTYFQDADGNVRAYIVRKPSGGGLPEVLRLPSSEVPLDATRIQAPNQFTKWLKGIFGDKKPVVTPLGGGPPLITDPNWGKTP
jgi:hypothetical protein